MAKIKDPVAAKERHNRIRRFRRQTLGFVFCLLALIGAGTIVYGAVHYVHSTFFDDTEDRQAYQQLIAPLVSMDPAPFDSLENADQDMLLEAAIWAALDYEDTTKYDRNEYDSIILPTVDVERYLSRMYGPSYTVEHHSFFDLDIEFVYDASLSAYIIPITSQSGSYMPRIEQIENSGSTRLLTVAYLQHSTLASDIVTESDAVTVSKYMEYILLRESGEYYIYAVQESDYQPPAEE